MTWLTEILKIELEEQLLIKYYKIKRLIFLKVQNMMDIKGVLLQWFINFLIKKTSVSSIKNENMSDQQLTEELLNSVIKKFNKRKVDSFYR